MGFKVKFKKVKKIMCTSLIIIMGISTLGACSIKEKEKEVVTLENQQEEIQDVLAIKKIDNIDGFTGERWLNDGQLLGIRQKISKEENKEISILSIYNTNNKTFKNLTTDKDEDRPCIRDITKDERYVLYEDTKDWGNWDRKMNTYIIDLKTGVEKKIAENVDDSSGFVDENKVITAKDMKLYLYDLNGKKEEIKLPQEMIQKMQDFSNFTLEDRIKFSYGEEKIGEEERKEMKEIYEYQKENNKIWLLNKKGDEIFVETYNHVPFVYNIKTKEYKQMTEEESKRFSFGEKQKRNKSVTKLEKNNSGENEIWHLDEKGNHKKLIAKGNFIGRYITLSPDETKGVYNMKGEKGDKNLFVYDFETEKSTKIFPEAIARIHWDKTSKQFFMTTPNFKEDKELHYVTSVVTLN